MCYSVVQSINLTESNDITLTAPCNAEVQNMISVKEAISDQ